MGLRRQITRNKAEILTAPELRAIYKEIAVFLPGKDFNAWLDDRDRARKDLFYLAKNILGKDLYPQPHQQMCDFFVKKNFDGVYDDNYTLADVHQAIDKQDGQKDRLLLTPRGSYKSTIDCIDCVQWIINVPDIRILILTGEYKLALAFMSEVKGYFAQRPQTDPTLFHALFPEFVLRGKNAFSDEPLECPARRHNQKEPTLWVNSLMANLSGWHCDVMKADDVVTNDNSNTTESRLKLKDRFDNVTNLIDEWGFCDIVGTRYALDDLYGLRLKVDQAEAPLRYLCLSAWTPRAGFEGIPLRELLKEQVELLFPEKLGYAVLRRKLLKNEREFRNQQLNDPTGSFNITFTEDALRARLVQIAAVPKNLRLFITWDWATSRTSRSDYSVGVCGGISDDGKLYIIDVVFNRWRPSELAWQIVDFHRKHTPQVTLIEKSIGAELLQLEVQRQAQLRQVPLSIHWQVSSRESDAKFHRIKGLETLLADDRLYFVSGWWVDEMFAQFCDYTGERTNRGRKDDIPDAIAMQQFYLPKSHAQLTQTEQDALDIEKNKQLLAELHRHLFIGPATNEAQAPPPAEPEPRDIFGGNGMRALNLGTY